MSEWTPETPYHVILLNDYFAVVDAVGNRIALVKRLLPGAERIAHQLAAEPDLYAALEALLIDADAKLTVFREDYGLLNSREAQAAIDQARAALARARGEA